MVNTIRTTTLAFFVFTTLLCYFPCSISAQSDTLKIVSVGENNLVIIDSIQISELSIDSFPQSTTGEINQTGKNNNIRIIHNEFFNNQNS